jgi:hypothetical protein
VEAFKPRHCGSRKNPQFVALKEDCLDYHLVESGGDKRRGIFAPKDLPDASPGGAGFSHLDANRFKGTLKPEASAPSCCQ